jgi:hypothetical protein
MLITRKSQVSGKTHTKELAITEAQLQRWQEGELIQRVFPDLSPNDREFLMTGITSEEWDEVFSEDTSKEQDGEFKDILHKQKS